MLHHQPGDFIAARTASLQITVHRGSVLSGQTVLSVDSSLLIHFFLDAKINFFAVHTDFSGRRNAEPDLIAADTQHGDLDVVANDQRFAEASG
jgi:hypothetical protein